MAAACDNRGIVPTVVKPLRTLIFALTLAAPGFVLGCHAQTPTEAGEKLSPELARRVAMVTAQALAVLVVMVEAAVV